MIWRGNDLENPIYDFLLRSWSGNANAQLTIKRTMERNQKLRITVPNNVEDEDLLIKAVSK